MEFKIDEKPVFRIREGKNIKDYKKTLKFPRSQDSFYGFNDRGANGNYLLLFATLDNNSIAGVCFAEFYSKNLLWLRQMFVMDKHRRRGIGTALVKKFISCAETKGAYNILCDSKASDKSTRKFLKKIGFRKVGKIKRHFGQKDYYLWEYVL
jgi:GNAT superfamily N-acetyltransferase